MSPVDEARGQVASGAFLRGLCVQYLSRGRAEKDNGTVTSPPLRCDSAQRHAPLADLGGYLVMPPRLPISSLRKGLAVVTTAGLIGAAAVFGAATADAATTQTGSCVDG